MNLWYVLASPARAFRRLQERPAWLLAYVVQALVSLAASSLAMPKVIAAQGEQAAVVGAVAMTVGRLGVVAAPLLGALFTGFLTWLYDRLTAGSPGFGRIFALAMWASVPAGTLGAAVRGLLAWRLPAEQVASANTSLAVLLPAAQKGTLLYKLALSLDPFAIWVLLLLCLGYGAFTGARGGRVVGLGAFAFAVSAAVTVLFASLNPGV